MTHMKMNCLACRNEIEFDPAWAGEQACPHCQTKVAVLPPVLAPAVAAANHPVGLECPFCHARSGFVPQTVMRTQGWVLLAIGLVFTPLLIGIPVIFFSLFCREVRYQCGHCRKSF